MYAGKAVQRGSVSVLAAGEAPRSVQIQDGVFTFTDLPAGPVKLAVHSPDPQESNLISRDPAPAPKKAKTKAAKSADGWFPIPEKYGHFDRSELTVQIAPGANKFDLDLKGP